MRRAASTPTSATTNRRTHDPEESARLSGMRKGIAKHSLVVAGHRTSVSLEAEFWAALKDIAVTKRQSVAALIATIDAGRKGENLSSAIRLFVLRHYRAGA